MSGRGRGAYYKEKYGNKRGRTTGNYSHSEETNDKITREEIKEQREEKRDAQNMKENAKEFLESALKRIDGQSYGAYKDIKGTYKFEKFTLIIDHVQSDPFAPPSVCIIQIPLSIAKIPSKYYSNNIRTIALCDFLNRVFYRNISEMPELLPTGGGYNSYKGGELGIAKPSQHVLQRSSVSLSLSSSFIEVRFTASMPAKGRTIVGNAAYEMLMKRVPVAVDHSLLYSSLNDSLLSLHIFSIEDQEYLRMSLKEKELVGFVMNDSILPRKSGVEDSPLTSDPIPFKSPKNMEVTISVPNRKSVTGMGIPKGITLIVGGGFHGKSTLLTALEVGIYNHIPGDGREFVVCDPSGVKIRAEDGRSVERVNILPFISNLPFSKPTVTFCTECASGSTSQSANIIEALEVGSTLLLIDEDTSATNFMIRDKRMQMLISKDKEPITPLVYKIKQMYKDYGVSVILVMGGSGDYFDVADNVIRMDCYKPKNKTKQAKEICKKFPVDLDQEGGKNFGSITQRIPKANFAANGKIKCFDKISIGYGDRKLDLSAVEQIVEENQTRVIADCIHYLSQKYMDGKKTLKEIVDKIDEEFSSPKGLDIVSPFLPSFYTRPRKYEIAAAINRLRGTQMIQIE